MPLRYIDLDAYIFGMCPVCKRVYRRNDGCEWCYAMGEAQTLAATAPAPDAGGEGAPQDAGEVPGGGPVRFDAGLDDAAYLEMMAEQRHEANYRAAHGLPPPDAGG